MELYLDNAATTYVDEKAKQQYFDLLNNYYGSTGSLHEFGQEALRLETEARNKIASVLNVKPSEIYFNSGATEGNNYAIKGVAFQYQNRGKTIITTKIEHPSVLECFKQLEKDFGFKCIYLDVDIHGVVNIEQLKEALNNDVILVSIMYVNHEVGSLNPIKQAHEIIKNYPKVIFHSDVTQAIGKCPIDLSLIDIATMSAHKIHGLKGSGFLYKKDKISLYPLINGHPAYNALRAGTANWPSNVMMATALTNTLNHMKNNYQAIKDSQMKLIDELLKIEEVSVNTSLDHSIAQIVNFSVEGYNPEVIIRAFSNRHIYVSSRSVCATSTKNQISTTLNAMHLDLKKCISSIRVSMDDPLNDEEIAYFINSLKEILKEIKRA